MTSVYKASVHRVLITLSRVLPSLIAPMHKAKGYVVVAATPVQFPATVETIIVPKTLYNVTVSFGNKTIYLDPKDGKSAMSRTLDGVLPVLKNARTSRTKRK